MVIFHPKNISCSAIFVLPTVHGRHPIRQTRQPPCLHRTHMLPSETSHLALAVRKSSMYDTIAGVVVGALSSLCTCVAGVRQKPNVQTRWVSMDPQRRPTQSIERHRHGVQGRHPRGLCRVCSEVEFPDVVFQAPSIDIADNKTDKWAGRTMDDYTYCCPSCEVWTVFPNSAANRDILLLLTFNSKVKGRCIKHLSPQMADVMQFERLIEFPVVVLFWRSSEHPVVRRRHPLFSADRNKH